MMIIVNSTIMTYVPGYCCVLTTWRLSTVPRNNL